MTNHQQQRAFLSLLIRPQNLSEEEIAQALSKILPTDLYTLRTQLKAIPPNIIAPLPPQSATNAINLLQQLGCAAFAPTTEQIAALGPTTKIKHLRLTTSGLQIETWRQGSTTINPDNIEILIQAKITESHKKKSFSSGSHPGFAGPFGSTPLDWVSHDLHTGIQSNNWNTSAGVQPHKSNIHADHKLDIHTTQGKIFQIDSAKFAFEFLGKDRDLSVRINMNQTTDFFKSLAPNAALDTYFDSFNAPPTSRNFHATNSTINKDNPTFAFYSRWAALVYRYLAQQ